MRHSLIVIACIILLPSCGQKGPLFLPQQAIATQPETDQAATSNKTPDTIADSSREDKPPAAVVTDAGGTE